MKQGDLFESNSAQSVFRQRYEEQYQKLNSSQKLAVDRIEGPVMVVAGPGTGKTQVLAMRIANILLSTDVHAHNVLCLSFTEAGAYAMRERLISIIGPDAHKVHIHTFHSFCNQVIKENPAQFGEVRQLEPIGDLEKIDAYIDLINGLPTEHLLKSAKSDPALQIKNLDALFRLIKKEAYSISKLYSAIDDHIAFKKEDKSDNKLFYQRKSGLNKAGDPKEKPWIDFLHGFDQTRAALGLFDSFKELMRRLGRYDFEDMIMWVLEAFEKDENLKLNYQERYQYILVDEYQDTSGSQNKILDHLTSYWEESPNVFVVGDDDQAIFKFQGANIGNIYAFARSRSPEMIVLTDNYRSEQFILDAAMRFIRRNTERLENLEELNISKQLQSQVSFKDVGSEIEIYSFANSVQELAYIATQIKNYHKEQRDLSEIAILYRNHKQVNELTALLDYEGIPINIKRKQNILELPLINNIITILTYILQERKDPGNADRLLFELLHYNFFDIASSDIARIYIEAHSISSKNSKANPDDESYSHQYIIKDFLQDPDFLNSFAFRSAAKLLALSSSLDKWISDISNETLQSLFQNILNEGGILKQVLNAPDKIWQLQILTSFFNHIKEETSKNPSIGLEEYLELLNRMKSNKIGIDAYQIFQNEKGVHFTSIHAAKGLEYEEVYIIGLSRDAWEGKRISRPGFPLPEEILPDTDNSEEDERRLLFVGMTRARKRLTLSFGKQNEKGADRGQSQFVDELAETGGIKIKEKHPGEDSIAEFLMTNLLKKVKKFEFIDKSYVDRVLQHYKLSVTGLNKYLKCPLSFYFEVILRVPTARSKYLGFGRAVHYALEQLLHDYSKLGTTSSSKFLNHFEKGMQRNRSHFTDQEFDDLSEYGRHFLPEYYEKKAKFISSEIGYRVEIEVEKAEYMGIPIKGILDKVELFKDHVRVTDYKTGQYESAKKDKLGGPNRYNSEGKDYWRQIVFYKLLLDSDKTHGWNMTEGVFEFVEPDRKTGDFHSYSISPTEEDLKLVGEQIAQVWKKIHSYEFEEGCGSDKCHWCQFMNNDYVLPSDYMEDAELELIEENQIRLEE